MNFYQVCMPPVLSYKKCSQEVEDENRKVIIRFGNMEVFGILAKVVPVELTGQHKKNSRSKRK